MIAKFCLSAMITLAPVAATAQGLSETHESISVPGKAINAYRPIQKSKSAAKCHPDATKAVACEAWAQQARAEALASRNETKAVKLGNR